MPFRHILLAAMVAMIWGGNFLVAKYGMQHFPPFLLSALRFFLVGVVLVPFSPRLQKGEWAPVALISLILGTFHFAFVISGMHYGLDIATSVITTQLGTPFACALGAIFLGDKLGPWRTFGLMIAFLGIITVVGTPNVAANYTGFLLVLFAALNFGGATVLMKRTQGIPIFSMVGWMGLMAAPQIMLISLFLESDQWTLITTAPWWAWASISYSVLLSTVVAYGLWYWLLGKYNVSQVTPFALLVPIFGITGGTVFYGEPLLMQTVIGGIITIIGVGIIIIRRPRTAELG